jgi:DNA replication protein DnaC
MSSELNGHRLGGTIFRGSAHGLYQLHSESDQEFTKRVNAELERRARWEAGRAEWDRKEREENARRLFEDRCLKAASRIEQQAGTRYVECSLDDYQIYDPDQRQVLARVKQLGARIKDSVRGGENLIFYGPCGTGKDHLAIALLYLAARQGLLGEIWRAQPLIQHLTGKSLDMDEIMDRVGEAYFASQVVLLSDVVEPDGELHAFILSKLLGVIEKRYADKKAVWLTANVTDEAELKAKLGTRIFDRLTEDCQFFHCDWESFRQRQRDRKRERGEA